MPDVKVTQGPVNDGTAHGDGETITVTEEQAETLLNAGVVELVNSEPPKGENKSKK